MTVERELMRRTAPSAFTRTASLLVCLLGLGAPAFASKDAVPDWVHAAIAQPLGKYPAETNAVVLLDETTLTIAPDGKAVEHHRHVVKILRPSGRDEGIVQVYFDDDSKIMSMHVWSVGPDGTEYSVKDKEIAEVGAATEGNYLYSDERFKGVRAPGRDPGGIVAYEYEQRRAPYKHEATWFFQDDTPKVKQSFTLELPAGYQYQAVWAHHKEEKPADSDHRAYRWELNEVPAIDLDRVPYSPSITALMGRMTIHYAPQSEAASLGTWQKVGDLYDQLSSARKVANPEITAKANELTAGKADFYDKTEAIAEFVQKDIRYFVIEKGIGGDQPHFAADIFHNRYGDCKDKSTLLSAMLSSIGIHSVLVLVDSERGFVDPEAPSALGNHAIAAIEIPKGYDSPRLRSVVTAKTGRRYLIVDPTSELTPYGQIEATLQGGYGVLVEGRESEIIQLPVLDPALNTVSRLATFQLQTDGSLKGSIVEKRFGDLSEHRRSVYSSRDAKQQRVEMERVLSHDFSVFNVSELKVENLNSLNKELTTSFDLSAERYGRNAGSLLMVRPRVMGSEGIELDRKHRQVPIDLGETMTAKDDFTIQLPEGYALDELPDPVSIDVGFAAYASASKLDGNSLHYTRTYTVRQLTLPADRYADLQKLAAAIDTDEQNHAVFKKK